MAPTDKPGQPHSPLPLPCRDLFPFAAKGVYLDTGSAGLSFTGQGAAAAAFYDEAKQVGYTGREIWQAKAGRVRAMLAAMLAVDPGEIEFFSGTTHGLNLTGYSIDWQPGDEIVIAADEFPSVRLAWQGAERAGAIIRLVEIPSESERSAALEAAIGERTRMVVAAHVHSNQGTVIDLNRIGQACRRHNALFVVDGIHALGQIPVDMSLVDIYTAGVFKWLLAGFGLSVFVCRPRARQAMNPAFRGYLNQTPEGGLQFAHVNYPGLYALEASLELLGEKIGWPAVYAHTAMLIDLLAAELARGGIELAAPPGWRSGCASFPVADSEALKAHLADAGMYAAAKGPLMRACPFIYTSREDIMTFARAVIAFARP